MIFETEQNYDIMLVHRENFKIHFPCGNTRENIHVFRAHMEINVNHIEIMFFHMDVHNIDLRFQHNVLLNFKNSKIGCMKINIII